MASSEMTVAPQPARCTCSSTTINRPVRRTLFSTVSTSSGRSHCKSITSTSIPSWLSCSAAVTARSAMRRVATTVTSDPARTTAALPTSRTELSSRTTVPFRSRSPLCSKTRTGSSSRMAARSSPYAALGELAAATLSPGSCRYHDSPVAECCVPNRPVPPPMARTVSGTLHWPPLMKRNLGSSLTIASPAVGRKSLNMISTTGRRPATAMPSATPRNPFSQMGVLRTRLSPNRSTTPSLVLNTPPDAPTSSPMSITVGSAAISSMSAAATASRYVISTVWAVWAGRASVCTDKAPHLLHRRDRAGGSALRSRVHRLLDILDQSFLILLGQHRVGGESSAEQCDGGALLPGIELAGRPVRRRVGARMSPVPIRLRFDQCRPLPSPCAGHSVGCSRVDGTNVLAVDDHPWHPVRLGTIRKVVDRGRRVERAVLAVQVVLDNEDDRRLPQRGHVQRLVERADVGCAVAAERHRHNWTALQLGGHRRSDCDREAGTDDGERADETAREVGEVHRTSHPVAAP